MKKLPILVVMVVLLSGCVQKTPPLPHDTYGAASETIQKPTEVEIITESSSQTSETGTEQDIIPTESIGTQEETVESTTPINHPTEDSEESVSEINVTQSEVSKEEVAIPETSISHSTEVSTDPQPTIDPDHESQTKPMDEIVPMPESKPQPQEEIKNFDVSVYVEYAKNYAIGQGLELDSTAVSCWDDPISANANSIYIERDIRDRLDWYSMNGFTAVWVWTEDMGNNQYNIYIGYV